MKKYDDDLNTTLIFVRPRRCLGAHVLSRITGRSVLRRDLRVHHSGPPPTPARPERGDDRSPSRHYPHNGQYCFRR